MGIRGDRIAAIGPLADAAATHALDCRGKVVAPGLIDVHNHSDGWMLLEPHQTWKTSQGFTTEVLAADGIGYAPVSESNWRQWIYYLRSLNALRLEHYRGWQSLADYMQLLDGRNVQNAATHVPYANVRTLACAFGRATPDDCQMRIIRGEIARGMEEGAVGLSTGLDYLTQNYATTEEIANACTAVVPFGGLYVTHVRYKLGLLPALREAVEIGRRSGVKVHISHLKGGDEREVQEVLAFLDESRKQVDLSFDVYPYQRGSTMLNFLLPYEVWEDGPLGVLGQLDRPEIRQRFAAGLEALGFPLEQIHIAWTAAPNATELIGMPLPEFVAQRRKPTHEALIDLLIESNLATLMVLGPPDSDHLVEPLIQHDLAILGSDGIYFPGGMRSSARVRLRRTVARSVCTRPYRLLARRSRSQSQRQGSRAVWPRRPRRAARRSVCRCDCLLPARDRRSRDLFAAAANLRGPRARVGQRPRDRRFGRQLVAAGAICPPGIVSVEMPELSGA